MPLMENGIFSPPLQIAHGRTGSGLWWRQLGPMLGYCAGIVYELTQNTRYSLINRIAGKFF
ncbi:MAG: hypothetical protein C7B45_02260 [Sulfobacillus acidophilus]|uniref:Uncharacterized protein n=1 Tax=Sulfobacillus acidophilus TaxID=53633 RepID=A0A2T2WN03_9FIRM|nr:MAG: hypothetical protein C7B45_02260 [Sulfobacillus acidophilus]